MIAIYKIVNNLTQKTYIGSSSNVNDRKEYHFRMGKNWVNTPINNKQKLSELYQDIHNLGKENFTFEIIEELDNIKDLEEKEQYYINSFKGELYNIDKKVKKVARGTKASKAILSNEQLEDILVLLQENKLSDREIAKIHNISFNVISEINNGISYHNDNISYPIRKYQQISTQRKFTEEQVRKYRQEYESNGHQCRKLYDRDNIKEIATYSSFYRMCHGDYYKEIK